MRIGTVLGPTVLLALVDRAGLDQDRPRPPLDRPKGASPFLRHQHRNGSSLRERRILDIAQRSALLTQGWDSELRGFSVFHLFAGLRTNGRATRQAFSKINWRGAGPSDTDLLAPS